MLRGRKTIGFVITRSVFESQPCLSIAVWPWLWTYFSTGVMRVLSPRIIKRQNGSRVVLIIQLLSRVRLFPTPWTVAPKVPLSSTMSQSLLKFMFIESVMLSSYLFLCHSLLLLPSIFPSIRVFSNESALHIKWPEYWSFSFSTSPSNEYSGLISFRIDWFDLLAVQRTLRSLL